MAKKQIGNSNVRYHKLTKTDEGFVDLQVGLYLKVKLTFCCLKNNYVKLYIKTVGIKKWCFKEE